MLLLLVTLVAGYVAYRLIDALADGWGRGSAAVLLAAVVGIVLLGLAALAAASRLGLTAIQGGLIGTVLGFVERVSVRTLDTIVRLGEALAAPILGLVARVLGALGVTA